MEVTTFSTYSSVGLLKKTGPNEWSDEIMVNLEFIHLKDDGTFAPGISDEQLLEVLIRRSEHFQEVLPCEENVMTLMHLRAALKAKHERTAKRRALGVEGTHQAH